jgi:hypothetical protein
MHQREKILAPGTCSPKDWGKNAQGKRGEGDNDQRGVMKERNPRMNLKKQPSIGLVYGIVEYES